MSFSLSEEYEILVKELLSVQLRDGNLMTGFEVFHDKKYIGSSGHQHQIDVAVELELAGVEIIILVECKRYSKRVGIDDVMELASRLDDIGAHKGIVVTTVGFQEGAVKFAKSQGIALVKACDLGWFPAHRMETREYIIQKRLKLENHVQSFLTQFLDLSDGAETSRRATQLISRFHGVPPLDLRTEPFHSLKDDGTSFLRYSPLERRHGFIVMGDNTQLVLRNSGLLALMTLNEKVWNDIPLPPYEERDTLEFLHLDANNPNKEPAADTTEDVESPYAEQHGQQIRKRSLIALNRLSKKKLKTALLRSFTRLLDIIISSILMLLLSPLMLGIAIAIKLDSEGPVLLTSTIGIGDLPPHKYYKFRTVTVGPAVNRRVTRVGRFLQITRLDILPSLVNILTGSMSFFQHNSGYLFFLEMERRNFDE